MSQTDKFPLANAIEEIRSELLRALEMGAGKELQFRLRPVELELTIAATDDATTEGGLKFWVVNLEGSITEKQSSTHKIKLTLEPITRDGRSDFLIGDKGIPEPD